MQCVLVQDLTADQKQLSHSIGQLVPTGGTALWDAVAFAARKLGSHPENYPVARALIVISDGKDNASRTTLKEAVQAAQKAEVFVCTISLPGPNSSSQASSDADIVGERAMNLLAERAGGVAFVTASLKNLGSNLEKIQQVLRSRYLPFHFTKTAMFQLNGEYRTIDVSAVKSGRKLRVYARRGYFAGTNPSNN